MSRIFALLIQRGVHPRAMQQLDRLRQLSLGANELLRHFWACFPTATPQRQVTRGLAHVIALEMSQAARVPVVSTAHVPGVLLKE